MIKLIELFQKIGSRTPWWTQGQGSNISEKRGNILYIKPTGFRLDGVQSLNQLAQVDLKVFKAALDEIKHNTEDSELHRESLYSQAIKNSAILDVNTNRASMESGFHALLPKRYVLHFHSLPGLLLAEFYFLHQEKIKPFIAQESSVFSSNTTQFVPYSRPGMNLSFALLPQFDWFFLKNHGVILQFDDPSDFEKYKAFEDRFTLWLAQNLKIDLQKILKDIKQEKIPKGELKYYFPDVAIFDEQLKDFDKLSKDRNIQENWQAVCVLQRAFPELKQLEKEEIFKIKNLPTELARLQNVKGK